MFRFALKWLDKGVWIYCRHFPVLRGKMRLVRTLSPYMHREGETRTATSRYGYTMKCSMNDWIQWQIHYFGDYLAEAKYARYLISESRPGDIFIDIGANVGYYSLLMSKLVGAEGLVYSYEAFESTYQRLLENLKLNDATNVVASQVAVASSSGKLDIEIIAEDNIGAARVSRNSTESRTTTVSSNTIDQMLQGEDLSTLRFLKMDIEGFEVEALIGAIETLRRFKPTCLIEIHRDQLATFGASPEELFGFMGELGYQAHHISDDGTLEPAGPDINANLVAFVA